MLGHPAMAQAVPESGKTFDHFAPERPARRSGHSSLSGPGI
jgi:hypothetical protein